MMNDFVCKSLYVLADALKTQCLKQSQYVHRQTTSQIGVSRPQSCSVRGLLALYSLQFRSGIAFSGYKL